MTKGLPTCQPRLIKHRSLQLIIASVRTESILARRAASSHPERSRFSSMSSSASASAYWRVAGMSYLKYSGLCADMVRAALKEPGKTKARTREVVFFRRADWKDGQPQKQSELQNTLMTFPCNPTPAAGSRPVSTSFTHSPNALVLQ